MSESKLAIEERDALLPTSEAADTLGVSPTSIKRWADAGRLPARKTAGGHRRYRKRDVQSLLDEGHEAPAAYDDDHEGLNGHARLAADEIARVLPDLPRAKIDQLPVGVIQLSDTGRVLLYNATETRFSGLKREDAEGKHFFGELAPCCNNRLVYGRFKRGVEEDNLDVFIDYTFTYRMRPTNVRLHLYRDVETRSNWMTVEPK